MVQISEQAAEVLLETLQASGVEPEQGLRLSEQQEGFALGVDTPAQEDQVILHKEAVVLIVDPTVQNKLGDDTLIDVVDTPDGAQLTLRKVS